MKLASLFDGSGGFPLGASLAGIEPVWASEVEPFPIAVTKARFPGMKHYGNVSEINGADVEPVDIITFGSPCQDLSMAGKREGLKGKRSNLFYEATRIIKEMRGATNGQYPRYAVWENVAGAFSSNGGADFMAVLSEFCSITGQKLDIDRPNKWAKSGIINTKVSSITWRTFNAQYWGVPQRRVRIYLVADFNGQSAKEILFKPESVSRNFGEVREAWQRLTERVEGCAGDASEVFVKTSRAKSNKDISKFEKKDVANTLNSFDIGEVRTNEYVIDKQKSYGINGHIVGRKHKNGSNGIGVQEECAHSLTMADKHSVAIINDHGVDKKLYENHAQDCRYKELKEHSNSVVSTYGTGGNNQPFVVGTLSKDLYNNEVKRDISNVLTSTDYKEPQMVALKPKTLQARRCKDNNCIVRRLTPTECGRLQGFPDWWCCDLGNDDLEFWRPVFDTYSKLQNHKKLKTDKQILKWAANPHTDSAEYKMWGNGVALPCVLRVMAGIKDVIEEEKCLKK